MPAQLSDLEKAAHTLLAAATSATAGAPNEASLRQELEDALKDASRTLEIPWTPFRLDLTLPTVDPNRKKFADVAHGALIIEYEPPRSLFNSPQKFKHACVQAEEYARLLSKEEGRILGEYFLVVWDGSHIAFGDIRNGGAHWSSLSAFGIGSAKRLLVALQLNGVPLVHPLLLANLCGPESPLGTTLIPALFQAILAAEKSVKTTKSKLLFFEWRRLFGQVVGVQTDSLQKLLLQQSEAHGQPYGDNVAAYLFALNTFIALVAKLVAALALVGVAEDIRDDASPVKERLRQVESGELFADAGVDNMLNGDFFAWYLDDSAWPSFAKGIETLIAALSNINFDVSRKSPDSTRDLFKGLYQSFVPRAVRHALGEFYTPDWLAAHVMNQAGWQLADSLTDPTCGTGTFLLEALRRRLEHATTKTTASELLAGLHGMDLNPLAVLAARASLVVFLSKRLHPGGRLRLPIYLSDAINPAILHEGIFEHELQTERGLFKFNVPQVIVSHQDFFKFFLDLRLLVESGIEADKIVKAISKNKIFTALTSLEIELLQVTINSLVKLHSEGWNGIWCSILADRFAAGSIPPADFVCGNPPWVKWSHLPRDYASLIKSKCLELGVFSDDTWVGGIESDISTVVTYVAAEKWLKRDGMLAFLITGTIFANSSSQGFRRFEIPGIKLPLEVVRVEDFSKVAPFEGVSNHATLLIFRTGHPTHYPVIYRWWEPGRAKGQAKRNYTSAEEFILEATRFDDLAMPVPGTDAGPWIKGTRAQHRIWGQIFGPNTHSYIARKGITTDANGIFFTELLGMEQSADTCRIRNNPSLGKLANVAQLTGTVESEHIFPLLRGRGVEAFKAIPDPVYRVLLPQRGMHGNSNLPQEAPGCFRYLSRFRRILEERSSFRRFQKGQAWWSVWSTGPYTFSPFKVAWREMSGSKFAAAIVHPVNDPKLGRRLVVLDHKLYFVPCGTLSEAAYLTGILNAPVISEAISAYASQLSLGVSVIDYLALPQYTPTNRNHSNLSKMALQLTKSEKAPSADQWEALDCLVRNIFQLT